MLTRGRGQERGTCSGLWAGDERNHTAHLPGANGSEVRSLRRTENKGSPLVSCLYFSSSEAGFQAHGEKRPISTLNSFTH